MTLPGKMRTSRERCTLLTISRSVYLLNMRENNLRREGEEIERERGKERQGGNVCTAENEE